MLAAVVVGFQCDVVSCDLARRVVRRGEAVCGLEYSGNRCAHGQRSLTDAFGLRRQQHSTIDAEMYCSSDVMCRLSVAMATVAATAAGDNKASSDRLSRDVYSVIHVPHAL